MRPEEKGQQDMAGAWVWLGKKVDRVDQASRGRGRANLGCHSFVALLKN